MNYFKVFVFFAAIAVHANEFENCQVSYRFAKICSFYNYYQKSCKPWNLATCRKIRTTLHEHKCPVYHCLQTSTTSPETITTRSLTTTTSETTTTHSRVAQTSTRLNIINIKNVISALYIYF